MTNTQSTTERWKARLTRFKAWVAWRNPGRKDPEVFQDWQRDERRRAMADLRNPAAKGRRRES